MDIRKVFEIIAEANNITPEEAEAQYNEFQANFTEHYKRGWDCGFYTQEMKLNEDGESGMLVVEYSDGSKHNAYYSNIYGWSLHPSFYMEYIISEPAWWRYAV